MLCQFHISFLFASQATRPFVIIDINGIIFFVYFLSLQREGPPPGEYKLSKDPILPKGPNVTSPFKSKTPRFVQPHVLVCNGKQINVERVLWQWHTALTQ